MNFEYINTFSIPFMYIFNTWMKLKIFHIFKEIKWILLVEKNNLLYNLFLSSPV